MRLRSRFEVQQKGKGKSHGKSTGPQGKSTEPFPVDWTKGIGKLKTKSKSNNGAKGKGYTFEEASLPETGTQDSQ